MKYVKKIVYARTGQWVLKQCNHLNLTQRQVKNDLGIGFSTIQKIFFGGWVPSITWRC